jgi:putative transferase (TIGR04331 family)
VIDHNATSYLQSLAMNAPTIIFWNPEHFEVMDKVKPDFKMLEDVGIYHKTPESAANFLNNHYDDIPKWWKSKEVQEARRKFCYKYARTSKFYLWEWVKFARSLP